MKKMNGKTIISTKKLLSFCSVIILLLCFLFSGCNITIDDYIPETFGEPEGLYLYNGNIRSFTDGSEQTEILTEITLGETVYGLDDFKIHSIAYMTETHEIFYTVSVNEKCLVWHVNYQSKISEFLYEFSEGETAFLEISDYYVLAKSNSTGVLFDKNAETVDYIFCGFTLNQDVLYKIDDNTFEFWKDGKVTTVEIQLQQKPYKTFCLGNYFYMFGVDKAVSVSLDSGETNYFNIKENTKGNVYYIYRSYVMDNTLYFVLNGNLNTLWKAENGEFEVVHTYSDENCTNNTKGKTYEKSELQIVNYGNGIINLKYTCRWRSRSDYSYHEHSFYYDAERGEINKGSKSIPESEPEVLTVGGYSFYITQRYYGHPLWGSFAGDTGYYYYLNREKDGKTDIMQYKRVSSFDDDAGKMFDDICEF